MPTLIYDSRDSACKTPFGAVPTGESVSFTIHLPKLRLDDLPVLKLYQMDHWDDPVVLPMEQVFTGSFVSNSYSCKLIFDKPCLYIYYFEVYTEGRLLPIKRGEDGAGQLSEKGSLWQMTVYDHNMKAPDFLREGVLYQIFPDRFYASGTPKENIPGDRLLREDWGGLPYWRPNQQGVVTNSDYFGGDLEGIRQKLDYLESLGVTALYLNPIFEAHSNHRYNTADYRNTDPLLGTNNDFARLCAEAKDRGISIILDGVFSHTGSDSIYFNREGRYGENTGAYNDPESPYRPWFQFSDYPTAYESWWGFDTLPNVNETEPSYLEFICGKEGVLRQWMELGASGFRLDVADELPDQFLDALHTCVKSYDPDGAIIGEVWEDASNKESYGVRRRYLLGRQLDSAMNYPYKDAVLNYIRWGSHQIFYDVVMQILENYPKPSVQCLMNSLSTHDTPRAITMLAGKLLEQHDRPWQEENHYLSPEEYIHGCKLFRLASILQFGLPGIPCVYYGDEAGLSGYRDPFNRVCYPWGHENTELIDFIRQLGAVRTEYPIFADAAFIPITFSREVCSFLRQGEQHAILFAVNRSHLERPLLLPPDFSSHKVLAQTGPFEGSTLGPHSGVVLLSECSA